MRSWRALIGGWPMAFMDDLQTYISVLRFVFCTFAVFACIGFSVPYCTVHGSRMDHLQFFMSFREV